MVLRMENSKIMNKKWWRLMFGVKQFFLVMFNGDRVGCGWWQTGRLLEWLVVSGCAVEEFLALNGLIVGDGWG